MTGRRLLVLLVVLAAIGVPAGVLQLVCAGKACEEDVATARVPFCPLPDALKELVANGYREGRSPDVLGVASETLVTTEAGGRRVAWPAAGTPTDDGVPVVFAGAGVAPAEIPDGVTLDRIAPTVSGIIGLERLNPQVRSGTAIEGVAAPVAAPPRLVLLIAWKGVGSGELQDGPAAWPFLATMLGDGAGTLRARAGSLPLDPAATLTTIGTGGLPSEHGITGSFVRNREGRVVPAFGPGSPVTVIATLADDLEEGTGGRSLIGLVATDEGDRGLVGTGWAYPDQDPVDVVIGDGAAVPLAVDVHLGSGYGADATTDVLGVVLDGPVRSMDARTERIVSAAGRATGGSVVVVVAGTGTMARSGGAVTDAPLVRAVERAVPGTDRVVDATVAGGMFLNRDVLTEAAVTGQVAVDAMLGVTDRKGREMMADAFQGFAVSFARYCR